MVTKAEDDARSNDAGHLFEVIRKLSGKHTQAGIPVKEKTVRLLNSQDEQVGL
jgi:hypothetical protein